ncbi:MAG: glycerol-3-phosphate acyltransferase [Armatimonadota bacterium]|nr:glycerol-3-phosphate acyltransferase [Armatimonadota bacterium]MDR7426795.1 glycerol-3-phosphate acyltransferase [Armatimonadota bacterium]MDR7463932.1 glycerol-3-phosphate acyltransferase [Armatimonadota bacterium]MDR7469885.1 glycerol-3-phosphate acyltransferase [Armatimonadota bacterium]MDR7474345.1 glycerol-3-phosphate acyltransferase [Armatimonadota bacterium]
MSTSIAAVLLPVGGYLSGSILPAHILARRRGVDFRALGKNPGTAETFRTFGFRPALLVYLLDVAKALLPLVAAKLLRVPGWSLLLTAAAAVAGHNWSVYYRFWGGKGLATASGVLLFLVPLYFSIALLPALLAWRRTGWVPASGVVGFPIIIVLTWLAETDLIFRTAAILLPLVILVRVRRDIIANWPFRPAGRDASR